MGAPDQRDHEDISPFPLSAVNRQNPVAILLMLQLFEAASLGSIQFPSGLLLPTPVFHQRKPQQFDPQLRQD